MTDDDLTTTLLAQVAALEGRVSALDDERLILATLAAYGRALDYGLEEMFLDCWTADAVLEYDFAIAAQVMAPPGSPPRRYEGHDELRGFFGQHTHAPAFFHKHLVLDAVVELDGDRAGVHSAFVRLDRDEEGPWLQSWGRYADVVTRDAGGRWRFARRTGHIESMARRPTPAARDAS